MAPHSEKMKMLRVVVREDFTKSRCDALIADFKLALQTLDALDEKKIQEHKEYVDITSIDSEDQANIVILGTNSPCVVALPWSHPYLQRLSRTPSRMRNIVCRERRVRRMLFVKVEEQIWYTGYLIPTREVDQRKAKKNANNDEWQAMIIKDP
jgi:hypothetical protein